MYSHDRTVENKIAERTNDSKHQEKIKYDNNKSTLVEII